MSVFAGSVLDLDHIESKMFGYSAKLSDAAVFIFTWSQ
jgi:hypothetical protein